MEKTMKTPATVAVLLFSLLSPVQTLIAQAQVPSTAEAPTTTTGVLAPTQEIQPTAVAPTVDDPRETFVLLAVLCFNEASQNEVDCKAIGHIRLRYARSRGMTLRETLLALHTERRSQSPGSASLRTYRATRPTEGDARSWLGDVRSDLHQPLGWSGTEREWARTARIFQQLFFIAQGIEAGSIGDTCEGSPIGWGGPRVDAESLARLRAHGHELVNCHGTANTYFRRIQQPATPTAPSAP